MKLSVTRGFLVAGLLLAFVASPVLTPAHSSGSTVPTEVRADPTMVAQADASITVTLSEPGVVHLQSIPAGVIDVTTTIPTTQATLSVPVSSDAPEGPVTIVLTSEGLGTATTTSEVSNP